MFVRWQKRASYTDISWNAVLVEGIRVDGKSRQRYIGCIASIRQSGIEMEDARARCWFWDHALERLHQFSNQVSGQDRERALATLAAKVPKPTREEYEFCLRRRYEISGLEWVGPLPEHGLYELPANFLDAFREPDAAELQTPTEPAMKPDQRDEEIARLKARIAELEQGS
jgi:hypothetical protein